MSYLTLLGYAGIFLVVIVLFNLLRQALSRNPNEPPVVLHFFPFIGSTISYGIDPYKFFFECRKKVSEDVYSEATMIPKFGTVRGRVHLHFTRKQDDRVPGNQRQ